jgi:hypothetical protein
MSIRQLLEFSGEPIQFDGGSPDLRAGFPLAAGLISDESATAPIRCADLGAASRIGRENPSHGG